jgi:putative ABC transport system permease protein
MAPITRGNVRMAWASIKSTRWRSFFTMFGVVVAVVPVLTILSIGEGVKRQVNSQIHALGSDLITIRPGNVSETSNPLKQFNNLSGYTTTGTLTKVDYNAVKKLKSLKQATSLSVVPGSVVINDKQARDPLVIAAEEDLPKLINHKVQYGEFFDDNDQKNVAVVGRGAAERIFGDPVPLGRAFEFRDETFIIVGVLERFNNVPLSYNTDLNNAIIIPFSSAQELAHDVPIYEILAKPSSEAHTQQAINDITTAVKQTRGGQKDFSVVTQEQNLKIVNRVLSLVTALVSGVAGIALLVSGIGIMNIMLVSVAERMHEIGVRKAIGASRRQIMGQFISEAVILSAIGGIIGIIIAFIVEYFVRLATELNPVITLNATLLVFVITLIVGVVFGSIPAFKAARKNPIDALRHE